MEIARMNFYVPEKFERLNKVSVEDYHLVWTVIIITIAVSITVYIGRSFYMVKRPNLSLMESIIIQEIEGTGNEVGKTNIEKNKKITTQTAASACETTVNDELKVGNISYDEEEEEEEVEEEEVVEEEVEEEEVEEEEEEYDPYGEELGQTGRQTYIRVPLNNVQAAANINNVQAAANISRQKMFNEENPEDCDDEDSNSDSFSLDTMWADIDRNTVYCLSDYEENIATLIANHQQI